MHSVFHMDCVAGMRLMPDNTFDSVVTDPPYELTKPGSKGGFMGHAWDASGIAYSVEMWREALRVLKPGGHLLAFSGSRTYHRMTCAIEDAGFEIRDQIMWVYGCLDEQTEVATANGVMPYHKTKIGDLVLCYDAADGTYSYQPILEIVEYEYSDTAYRLVGDFGEQVVSRNHRVIVECGGNETFRFAETLQCEARVPVLEDLPALQHAVHDAHKGTGYAKQNLRPVVCSGADRPDEHRGAVDAGAAQGCPNHLPGVRQDGLEACGLAAQGDDSDMRTCLQRDAARGGMGEACPQGPLSVVARIGSRSGGAHDGADQSRVEGRPDLSQPQGGVCESGDQVRAVPGGIPTDGAQGRLCDRVPAGGCAGTGACADESGDGASHRPRRDEQHAHESDAVCDERATQGVRAWAGHRSALVRVVPFHHTGKVWCLRVPTGAFVAVRGGVAFPTGNSGFPKSLDVSKAIDKAAGAVRATVRVAPRAATSGTMAGSTDTRPWVEKSRELGYHEVAGDEPVTPEAQQWQGWGTALKPAHEPICVARKPLAAGTVAANVLEWGTGAINVDGCRVGTEGGCKTEGGDVRTTSQAGAIGAYASSPPVPGLGRWPANLIHDGSDEVLVAFPQAKGQQGAITGTEPSAKTANAFGDFTGRARSDPRGDIGSAARFFYCAKAGKWDRDEGLDHIEAVHRPNGNKWTDQDYRVTRGERSEGREAGPRKNVHPTVKPNDLMRYLCRLVTPPGGTVLDPFTGSGSTGKAAKMEGFNFVGFEMQAEYVAIAEARIAAARRTD